MMLWSDVNKHGRYRMICVGRSKRWVVWNYKQNTRVTPADLRCFGKQPLSKEVLIIFGRIEMFESTQPFSIPSSISTVSFASFPPCSNNLSHKFFINRMNTELPLSLLQRRNFLNACMILKVSVISERLTLHKIK